ncbi:MAG: regulatory protein RecX [Chloroflexi bacterium]|nr:regulatory protein RecX [Chloroflexota bacterium]
MKDEDFNRCYETALHFLDYRQRSEAELRDHLLYKRKCSAESVKSVLDRLKQSGLVDDRAFAVNWTIDRVTYKQKSGAVIRQELLQKGIDPETANLAIAGVNDEANALKAGLKKARLLRNTSYLEFSRRLSSYLSRRGYSGEVVHKVIARLWDMVNQENPGK